MTLLFCREDQIRTGDPLHPMQVRYRAAPLPERGGKINKKLAYCKPFQGLGDYFLCPKHLSLRNS